MVPVERQRTLLAFAIHGRADGGVLNYSTFFEALTSLSATERQVLAGEELLAVTRIGQVGENYSLRFVLGQPGIGPLTFDPDTGEEQYEDVGNRFAIRAAWAYVNPISRFVVVERRRPGVPAVLMANALASIGRNRLGIGGLNVSLQSVGELQFLEELNSFDRIRQAYVVLDRPNYNWANSAAELAQYSNESNADSAEIGMTARRGESLERNNGIVSDIKEMAARAISPLRNARIVGRRNGEHGESTLSFASYQEKRRVSVGVRVTATEEHVFLEGAAQDFLDELAAARREDDDH